MPTETLDVRVRNLDCEHDARALERVIGDSAGVESLRVLPKAGRVTLSFDPSVISGAALREQLAASGFHLAMLQAPVPGARALGVIRKCSRPRYPACSSSVVGS